MKLKKSWIFVFFILSFFALAGCGSKTNYDDKVKVVFELEGGIYQNCELPIVHFYGFEKGSSNLIYEPQEFSKKEVTKSGYKLEGWYREKNVGEGESVTYSGRWDFSSDKVTEEGITLYARWKKNVNYTYDVCYRDGNDEEYTLGTYEVNEGEAFDDYLGYASKRDGYTPLNFRDEEGELWKEDYRHPGGDTDLAVKVYVEYIEGDYAVVRTAAQLKANKSKNIYLAADIDFQGTDFAGFGDYKGTFLGNGHKISNFNLAYSTLKDSLVSDPELDEEGNLLCIGLFGTLDGATVKDVSFTDVKVDVKTSLKLTKKIFVAPLCVKMKNSTVQNVTFGATFSLSKLPDGFAKENLVVVTNRSYYFRPTGDTSVIEGVELNITDLINNPSAE